MRNPLKFRAKELSFDDCIALCVMGANDNANDKKLPTQVQKVIERIAQGPDAGISPSMKRMHNQWLAWYSSILNDKPKARFPQVNDREVGQHLSWLQAITIIVCHENYKPQQIIEPLSKLTDPILHNITLGYFVEHAAINGQLTAAEAFIAAYKPAVWSTTTGKAEDMQFNGYRTLLEFFASEGNIDAFFTYLPAAKPKKSKLALSRIIEELVQTASKNQGYAPALRLCEDERIGTAHYVDALRPLAEKGEYQQLKQIFADSPKLRQPDLGTEAEMLCTAYYFARKDNLTAHKKLSDDDFNDLFQLAIHIDRKIRVVDVKLQDSVLRDLANASRDDRDRVLQCRKAIKDNYMKHDIELT